MTALLSSLNIGQPSRIDDEERWTSGIYKLPVTERLHLSTVNLAGDAQADLKVHGGPDKAVCVYSADHYSSWRQELGVQQCGPGWFGENFSIEGQHETDVAIGDTYRIGTAVVQVSQPRAPCWKLGRRWNRLDMPKLVLQSGRTGWYVRVLQEGGVQRGDTLELIEKPFPHWTIDAVNSIAYSRGGTTDAAAARELAECPALAESWRGGFRSLAE